MNNKTIIKFSFRIIWKIMEISEDVIRRGRRPRWIRKMRKVQYKVETKQSILNKNQYLLVIQHRIKKGMVSKRRSWVTRSWESRMSLIFSSKQFSYLISPIQYSCSFSSHIGKSLPLWIEKPASSIQGHVIFWERVFPFFFSFKKIVWKVPKTSMNNYNSEKFKF